MNLASKVLKFIGKFSGASIEWFLILFIFIAFAVRTSIVQTFLAKKATAYFSKELNTDFHIERVSIVFFNRVILDGLQIQDRNKKNIAHVKSIYLKFSSLYQFKKQINIERLELKNGQFELYQEKISGRFNYDFITDYFSPKTKSKKSVRFKIKEIALINIDAKYDDYREKEINDEIDYSHIHLKKLYLFANKLSLNQGVIKAKINHLSLNEKCGLVIHRFSCYSKVSSKGIFTKDLKFKTNQSDVFLPKFAMSFNQWSDFEYFDDKVFFDAVLNKSVVSMRDIQYFTSELAGMNQLCEVEASNVTDCLKKMNIQDLVLRFGKESVIKADLILPDFRYLNNLAYKESIDFIHVSTRDIETFQFPLISEIAPIQLIDFIDRLDYFEGVSLAIKGTNQHCKITSENVSTSKGSVSFPNGIWVDYVQHSNSYLFKSTSNTTDLVFKSIDVGGIIKDESFGKTDAILSIKGEFDFSDKFELHSISGNLNRFEYNNYTYDKFVLNEVSYQNDAVSGRIEVDDPNVNLVYEGAMDFNGGISLDFKTEINLFDLQATHFLTETSTDFSGVLDIKLVGQNIEDCQGTASLSNVVFNQAEKRIVIPFINVELERLKNIDRLTLESSVCDLSLEGSLNMKTLFPEINNKLSLVLPIFIQPVLIPSSSLRNNWDFVIESKDANELIHLFAPDLSIAKGSTLIGQYGSELLKFKLRSSRVKYDKFVFHDLYSNNILSAEELETNIDLKSVFLSDSSYISNVTFQVKGRDNLLNSTLNWYNKENFSQLEWNTLFKDKDKIDFNFLSSFVSFDKLKWQLNDQAIIRYESNKIHFFNVGFSHLNQSLDIEGVLSESRSDLAKINIKELAIENLNGVFNFPIRYKGILSAEANLSSPFHNPFFKVNSLIKDLYLDRENFGDVVLNGEWENELKSFSMSGKVAYQKIPSLNFQGRYFTQKENNNLGIDLSFNETDIQFVNAFIDPEILKDVEGKITGDLHLGGTIAKPILDGEVNLRKGRAFVTYLGINTLFEGKILAENNQIHVNNIPVKDEEGNTGSLVATFYHQNFKNWLFDLNFNLINDICSIPGYVSPLNRFLVLNTNFKEGDVFYGKGYATGDVNINGTFDMVEISANLESKTGSAINFPMYGASSVVNDEFITFKSKKSNVSTVKTNFFSTGLKLDLNFKVTPLAKIRMIFDERSGNEITAFGQGDFNIKLSSDDELTINGVYEIKNNKNNFSTYNFVLGPVMQPFIIEEKGTVSWTGDPFSAILDLTSYYKVATSLKDVMPTSDSKLQNTTSLQDVKCNLKLSESILKPRINFELELLKGNSGLMDDAKAAISRINSNKDELNKQFFSLLIWKKFQPLLSNTNSVGTNAVADLVSSQINSLLGDLSKDYKLNVTYNVANSGVVTSDQSQLQSSSKIALGVSKNLFDGKLIVNGLIGRSTMSNQSNPQSLLIGNLNLEFKMNEKGTFKVRGFNETNDIITTNQLQTRTTQGLGFNYQEEFSTLNEFVLFQSFLDVFRKNKNRNISFRKNTSKRLVPKEVDSTDQIRIIGL